jgi:C1A family cysteine protease
MKKIIGIILVLLLIGFLVPTCDTYEVDIEEKYYAFQDDITPFISGNCGCAIYDESAHEHHMIISERLDYSAIPDQNALSSKPTVKADLPDYFSWKDHDGQDWTTPAKDQGNCGSCWDFAAIGGLECIISIRENCAGLNPDLSEQYVLSCLPRTGSCGGGLARLAYKYINRTDERGNNCNGVVLESCMPYKANDDVDCADKCEDWNESLIPISDYGYWSPDGSENDRAAIKTQIMEHGPVVATMLFTYYEHGENNLEEWGWTHSSPDDYYPYPGSMESANHQVVLVGWKDDLAIGNGGYWIVKNSCSSEWGYNGFFNIEYGSLNIDSIEIDWVEYDPDLYNNWAPKTYSNGIYEGKVNEEITFDGTHTTDPEDDIIQYLWNFGDGTEKTGVTRSHIYDKEGIYPVTLTVTDAKGNIGIDETWAFIDRTNSPPDTPIIRGKRIGQIEKEYEYTFYTNDPDGDDVYYYLNWGDVYWTGSWHPWIGPYKSGEKVTLTNIWDTHGNYEVRVKVKDKYEAKSDWVTLPVVIPSSKNIRSSLLPFFEMDPQLLPFLQQIMKL